jgi:hypothetical protein
MTNGTYQRGIQNGSRNWREGRQYNGHKKNDKKTNNGRQNTTQKTED